MTRAVARRRLPLHEDWTILTIVSLPLHEVHFSILREIVQEFLVGTRESGFVIFKDHF
jgi:hypothetical protein